VCRPGCIVRTYPLPENPDYVSAARKLLTLIRKGPVEKSPDSNASHKTVSTRICRSCWTTRTAPISPALHYIRSVPASRPDAPLDYSRRLQSPKDPASAGSARQRVANSANGCSGPCVLRYEPQLTIDLGGRRTFAPLLCPVNHRGTESRGNVAGSRSPQVAPRWQPDRDSTMPVDLARNRGPGTPWCRRSTTKLPRTPAQTRLTGLQGPPANFFRCADQSVHPRPVQ